MISSETIGTITQPEEAETRESLKIEELKNIDILLQKNEEKLLELASKAGLGSCIEVDWHIPTVIKFAKGKEKYIAQFAFLIESRSVLLYRRKLIENDIYHEDLMFPFIMNTLSEYLALYNDLFCPLLEENEIVEINKLMEKERANWQTDEKYKALFNNTSSNAENCFLIEEKRRKYKKLKKKHKKLKKKLKKIIALL